MIEKRYEFYNVLLLSSYYFNNYIIIYIKKWKYQEIIESCLTNMGGYLASLVIFWRAFYKPKYKQEEQNNQLIVHDSDPPFQSPQQILFKSNKSFHEKATL